jgi:tripartite-type tricarboxylate transporter receptor subunit TctC
MNKRFALIACALLACADMALAQPYPSRPVTLIVPFGAGGPVDTLARILSEAMHASLGQPVLVENVTGASGTIGVGRAARANPDGYTVSIGNWPSHVVASAIYPVQYDVLKDFAPVARLSSNPYVVVGRKDLPANNLKELIAYAKANPGKLSYGSTGIGTQLHIGMEMFKLMTKTDILHVPYRATTAAMADLMGSRIDLILIGLSSAKAQVEGGKLRAYAIAAPQRSPLMPDVPSADEAGLPGYEVRSWFGMFAPAKTPQSVIDRLSREIKQASTDPKFVAALAPQGMQIVASSPSEMAQSLRDDYKKWGDVIRQTGTTINQ